MGFIDIIIVILLLIGLYKGIKNGFFVEIASLVAFVIGVFLAIKFSYLVKDILSNWVNWSPETVQITAFALTIVLVIAIVHLSAALFTKIANFAFLGWVNTLFGGIFGVLKSMLALGIFLTLVQKANVDNFLISKQKQEASVFYQPLQKAVVYLFPIVTEWVEEAKATYEESGLTG
jgi:membrane protein required for colicin V production